MTRTRGYDAPHHFPAPTSLRGSSDPLRHGLLLGGDFNFLSEHDAPRSTVVTGMQVTKGTSEDNVSSVANSHFLVEDRAGISDHAPVCCMVSPRSKHNAAMSYSVMWEHHLARSGPTVPETTMVRIQTTVVPWTS